MGLKSGSRDAGLDEADTDEAEGEMQPEPADCEPETGDQPAETPVTGRHGPVDDGPHGQVRTREQARTHDQSRGQRQKQREGAQSDGTPSETDQGEADEIQRPTVDSLPYKLRREKVNEGREQVPYFLREEVIEAEDELQAALEELLGEKVYKSDYREAAMVVAQRNPGLVADVLREWGYDLDTS